MDEQHRTIEGARIRWQEAGEGTPVVFLHGIPTSPGLWRHVVPHVRARSLAWEMVGYGSSISEGRGRDISVARQAEYLVAWMQAEGIERAVLAGHDLGGGVAQVVAVQHPERVAGLVLTNSIAYDSWPVPAVKAVRGAGPFFEQLPDSVFKYIYETLLRQGHDRRARAEESVAEHWSGYANSEEGGARAFVRQARALDVRDTLAVADQLSSVEVPARLVWGVADRFQKEGCGYRLAYDLDAPLDRVERGKHFVPEDHPRRVATAVNEVVEEVARHETEGS